MQTLLDSILSILLSAVGCGIGAYIGLSFHNEISRCKRRKEGKQPKPDNENPIKLFKPTEEAPSETPIAFSVSAFYRWLAKWGFKKNINMLQLMQYRVDEYQGDLGLLLKESVYARIPAKEYLVTLHGEYVLVDADTLTKMEADFYSENVSPNSHLIAIPKDWVDEMLNKHPELILTDVD